MILSKKQEAVLRELRILTDRGIREPNRYRSWLRPQDVAAKNWYAYDTAGILRRIADKGFAEKRRLESGGARSLNLYRISDVGRQALEAIDGPGTHAKPEPYVPLIDYLEKGGVRQFGREPAETLS